MSDELGPMPDRGPDDEPPPVELPRWIPVMIGLVLVVIAGFAVYTGMKYRGGTTGRLPAPSTATREEPGAPGEPQAGASRMLPGGEDTPQPSTAHFEQQSRVRLEGGSGTGIGASYRAAVRRGIQLKVVPGDAILFVNDQPMAPVQQYAGSDEVYEFAEPGNFTIRISAPGYRDAVYLITADPDAKDEVGLIETQLQKVK